MKPTPYRGPKRPKERSMVIGWHPLMDAIETGASLDRIFLNREEKGDRTNALIRAARAAEIPVLRVPREKLDRLTVKNHQGVVGFISPIEFQPLEELIASAWESGEAPVFVVLDGVTDVRNMGAIARSAECFGATALVIPKTGSAPLREDAIKSSSGALLRIPVARVDSIEICMNLLHNNGVETVGLTEKGEAELQSFHPQGAMAWVLGDEETGLSDVALRSCQTLVRIPMSGSTGSLNVSVAAGIALFSGKNHA